MLQGLHSTYRTMPNEIVECDILLNRRLKDASSLIWKLWQLTKLKFRDVLVVVCRHCRLSLLAKLHGITGTGFISGVVGFSAEAVLTFQA